MAGKPSSISTDLETLNDALRAKYPSYAKGLGKAVAAGALKKAFGAKVPGELAALWGFANGASSFFVSRACEGMDLLSLGEATDAIEELGELDVGFPKGAIPFATDGAGHYLAIETTGKVFDWDHETRKAKPVKLSLQALVLAVATAAKNGKFGDGPEVVSKPNAAVSKALKLIESDAKGNGYKVTSLARKLPAADALTVLRALASHPKAEKSAFDALAVAEAGAGLFADAIAHGKKGEHRDTSTLHNIGEIALDAGRAADAEEAFASIKGPNVYDLLGIAVAQKQQGKDFKKALDLAVAQNKKNAKAKKVDWQSATSSYGFVGVELCRAMALALKGDKSGAEKVVAAAKKSIEQVVKNGVRQECLGQLDDTAGTEYYSGTIRKHCMSAR